MTDEIEGFCADILSERVYESFVRAVVSQPMGGWGLLPELCAGHTDDLPERADEVFVAWLPDARGTSGYVTLFFFSPVSLWSYAAIYNTAVLGDAHRID